MHIRQTCTAAHQICSGPRLETFHHVEASRELPVVSILLVDDRPENLCALEASLEPLGQRLVCVSSGDDALRAVLDEDFAVILIDVKMPGLDGFETIELLRERERSRHIPIIFLSGYSDDDHVLCSYSAGAVDYLLKPFNSDALRSKVSVFVHLRQNELALKAAHVDLERRVEERTAELVASNKALEREIIERKTAEQRLFEQAHHDGLTGLPNRALLMAHLDRAVAQWRRRAARGFAVMMIDLDRFKSVNDSLGHLAGDQLLTSFARRLESCLREVDTAARLGGDEFAVLLDGITDLRDATRLAERIQHALVRSFSVDGKELFASASIGIVVMNDSYRRGDELLRDADTALYRAKEAGRARYQVFDLDMHATVVAQLALEADLSRAIERDELVLHYQPIIELERGAIVGFEALVRWDHPMHGLVLPTTLVPIAEETGMIRQLGQWVFASACKQLGAWGQPDLEMSVNLSAQQLAQTDLCSELERATREAGIDPGQLKLEITESAMMACLTTAKQTLSRIRDLGIAISLDDFGTGYSSLSYLHEFPVAELKVDRSFVQRIGSSEERPEILRAIVSLAHNLGIQVTAEGVETVAHLERVRQLECEHAQGYYFARPLEAAAARDLIVTGLPR